MSTLLSAVPTQRYEDAAPHAPGARDIYDTLSAPANAAMARAAARNYLQQQLLAAEKLSDDLPERPEDLLNWARSSADQVGVQYQAYLAERKNGAPRRFFTSKSHALYFLRAAAPTKLVDGSWLYSALQQWQHQRQRQLFLHSRNAARAQKAREVGGGRVRGVELRHRRDDGQHAGGQGGHGVQVVGKRR